MRENYNSISYWENVINRHSTIRGHMFMQNPPNKNSLYLHTLIFNKSSGINNIWGYFPNVRVLCGYIEYSFLQEGFSKWIYEDEKNMSKIPTTVMKLITQAEKTKRISKEIATKMKREHELLTRLWNMPTMKAELELRKFTSDFNKAWMGDSKKFLYLKFFKTPEEFGEFVITSSLMTGTEGELENKIGMTLDEWRNLCTIAETDPVEGMKFRDILLKNLSQVL